MPYHPDDLEKRDPRFIERVLPLVEILSAKYFDLRCEGEENIPNEPVVFACNHNNGILGPEVLCTLGILWKRPIPVWGMAHDFAMVQLTPLGRLLQRGGGVRATPENAQRVLERGQLLVYPGGDLDSYRHFSRRNEIVIAPRSGFVRVAQKAKVRIVPVVAAGAHRSAVIVAEGKRIARALRLRDWARIERFPIAFALPWGVALGPWTPYLPLPFGVRLRFLPEIDPAGDPQTVALHVQTMMQRALDEMRR